MRHAAPVGMRDERHAALGGDVRRRRRQVRERLVVVGIDRPPPRPVPAGILGDVGDADREDLDVVVHARAGVGRELRARDHQEVLRGGLLRERPVVGDRARVESHPFVVTHVRLRLELPVGAPGVGVQGRLQPDALDVEREPVRHPMLLPWASRRRPSAADASEWTLGRARTGVPSGQQMG